MQFNVTQCIVVGMQLKGQLQKVCHLLSRPKVEKNDRLDHYFDCVSIIFQSISAKL